MAQINALRLNEIQQKNRALLKGNNNNNNNNNNLIKVQIPNNIPGIISSNIPSNIPNNIPIRVNNNNNNLMESYDMIFLPQDLQNGQIGINRAVQISSSQPDPASKNSKFYGICNSDGRVVGQKIIPINYIINSQSTITVFTPGVTIKNCTCYLSGQTYDCKDSDNLVNLYSSTNDNEGFQTNTEKKINENAYFVGNGKRLINIYFKTPVSGPGSGPFGHPPNINPSNSITAIIIKIFKI